MNDEPRYVDDPWEEDSKWWDTSTMIHNEVIHQAMDACRRSHRFKSLKEKSRWSNITKRIAKGTIPLAWAHYSIAWAAKKNREKYPIVAIKLDALASLILNRATMEEWLGDNPDERQGMIDAAMEGDDDYPT